MKESDLVMLRLPNDLSKKGRKRHYNVWFRIMFIDNDETFIGRVEKIDKNFELYKIGEDIRLDISKPLKTYMNGDQFCYGDNVTICNCTGLCKNK